MDQKDTLVNLEYSIEQGCWHYNYGNEPERPEWFTVAEQQPLSKVSSFCDVVDATDFTILMSKQDLITLYNVFDAGYQIALVQKNM